MLTENGPEHAPTDAFSPPSVHTSRKRVVVAPEPLAFAMSTVEHSASASGVSLKLTTMLLRMMLRAVVGLTKAPDGPDPPVVHCVTPAPPSNV